MSVCDRLDIRRSPMRYFLSGNRKRVCVRAVKSAIVLTFKVWNFKSPKILYIDDDNVHVNSKTNYLK